MTLTNPTIVEEALDEISAALQDSKGISAHQRRLAFVLSAGSVALLEQFLQKRAVYKTGSRINHQWLKKKKENVKIVLSRQITCPIEKISELDRFLESAYAIEKERNQLAYGKPVSEEKLKELIQLFLNFKEEVEHA